MKLNDIHLNKLLVFAAVADAGGYGGASETLGLTRSAISQAITSLEEGLKLAVFHRVGRKLVLTDAGRQLLSHVRQARLLLQTGLNDLTQRQNRLEGELRIGAHTEFAKTRLLPLIVRLRREHPGITVRFVFDAPSRMQRLLERGRLDVVFSIDAFRASRGLRSTRVLEEKMLLVAPRGWLAEEPELDEILRLPLIDYYESHQLIRRWISFHFKRRASKTKVSLFAATAEMVVAMVEQRLGIGVVPDYILNRGLIDRLMVIRPGRPQLKDHIWMSRLANSSANTLPKEPLTALIEELTENFQLRHPIPI